MTEPRIRFCTSIDGVRIAYMSMGEGRPVLWLSGWMASGLERRRSSQELSAFTEQLARRHTVVTFDQRGLGDSQREINGISIETQTADALAVVDHLNLDKFDLLGFVDGAVVAAALAARHPERVTKLVLSTPFAQGRALGGTDALQALADLCRNNWAIGRRTLASIVSPGANPTVMQQGIGLSVTGEVAAQYIEFMATVDIASLLTEIRVPTVVVHGREDVAIPLAAGKTVAASIPDAAFVTVDGTAYPSSELAAIVSGFLDGASAAQVGAETSSSTANTFRSVLFTDLVGHTEMMQRLGDEKGREVLREHERITREVLKAHGGTEVKTMGDGFLASFGSVTKAVECAVALQRKFEERRVKSEVDLSVRCGLNAGEPIEEDGDLFGSTVILASRIAAAAQGGEVLASMAVRELCSGKGFLFADRGEFVAKGFEEPVRVLEVSWRE